MLHNLIMDILFYIFFFFCIDSRAERHSGKIAKNFCQVPWRLKFASRGMVSASPPPPPHYNAGGDLIWKFGKILWGQNFFLNLWGDKCQWGELKLYGGSIFITTISLFHFFRNSQHPEKWSVSVKNFFRKCECISSCYLPISSNLWKNSLRKTSLFVLFEHLPTGLLK